MLTIDNEQNLWIGSNLGISKFDLKKYKETIEKYDPVDYKYKSTGVISIKHYGLEEGFMGIETNNNAVCVDHEGSLWTGTIKGLIKYNPNEDKLIEVPPIIKIVGLDIYSDSEENKSININQSGSFNYGKNTYSFKYLGISQTIPTKVIYKHKLDGYEFQWSEPSSSTSMVFTGLPVGDYIFKIKAANADGLWTEDPVVYKFTILPPFWKSTWFYLILSLLFGFFVYGFIILRLRALNRVANRLKEQVDLKTIELQTSEKQYRNLFEKISDGIFVIDKETHRILDFNEAVLKEYNFSTEELLEMTQFDLHPKNEHNELKDTINVPTSKHPKTYTHLTKDGRQIYVEIASKEIEYNKRSAMLCIVRDITERKIASEKIKRINRQLIDSVKYAKRILDSILQSKEGLKKLFPDSFVFFKPKDIVSGDFYWCHKKNDKMIVAVADCMGHGIAGAFMSLIANELLQDIIVNQNILDPPSILSEMHKGVVSTLTEEGKIGATAGGMDLAICLLDHKKNILEFAGAGSNLKLYRDGDELIFKGNKFPIGLVMNKTGDYSDEYYNTKKGKILKIDSDKIAVKPGDTFYLFTDGFCDQFGGDKGDKFMNDRFSKLLLANQAKSMIDQEVALNQTITEWQGKCNQVDDMLVVGIRI